MTTDELLRRLRAGAECSAPIMRGGQRNEAASWSTDWRWKIGSDEVSNVSVATLRKRGLIAISEGVLFRYIRLLETPNSLPLHGCGSVPSVR
jgi:hypothetical protein